MRPILVALLIASTTSWRPLHTADERAGFVTTLGRDTVVYESYTRSNSHLDGNILVRVPGTVLCHYTADIGSDGNVTHTALDMKSMTPAVPSAKVTIDIQNGAAKVTVAIQGQQERSGVVLVGNDGVPTYMTGYGSSYGLYSSLGFYELFLPHVTPKANDTTSVKSIDIATAKVLTRKFVRRSPTQIGVDFFGIAWTELTVDAAGHITAADASGTTEKTQTQRTDFIDLSKMASTFAAADKAGHGVGVASPDTTVSGSIGGQAITVKFGSPRKRGRDILGNVVQYDHVWRTGANAATTITFPHDVSVGAQAVPAGTYSLWTLPAKNGTVNLIINKQSGQWGTDYDPAQDLARVPMQVATATPTREDFDIGVTGSGNAGELRMSWDTFVWTVPITAK